MMKPLAYIFDRIDKYKYNRKQFKISKWTDEYVMRLYAKIVIKQLIRWKGEWEEFVVAEWCNDDYELRTVIDEIRNQRYNKDLSSWAWKSSFRDVDRIEKLTELLRLELEKYNGIKCKYIMDDKITNHSYWCKNYKKTLIVELNM